MIKLIVITRALIICGFIVSSELMAEESGRDVDSTVQLEELQIIGNKTNSNVNTLVHSVSIITAEEIEDSTILDLRDIFSRTANIQEDFNIRGVGAFSIAGGPLTAAPLVGMYIDGAIASTFSVRNGPLEVWDVQQVEIYRGTQSINLGRSSLAGGVAIKTNDPTYDWTLHTRTQFASYNTLINSFAGGGPIIEDQLAFRIAFDHQTSDGYVENPTLNTKRSNDNANMLIRGKLLFEPINFVGFKALASLSYSENREGDNLVVRIKGDSRLENADKYDEINPDPISPFKRKIYSNHAYYQDVDSLIAILDLEYQLNDDWRIHSVSTYGNDEYKRHEDGNRRPDIPVGPVNFNVADKRIRDNITSTYTKDIRLHYENKLLRSQIGAYYFSQNNQDESLFSQGTLSRNQRFTAETENWAVFGKLEVDLTNWLTVFAGARYDNETQILSDYQRFKFVIPFSRPSGTDLHVDQVRIDSTTKTTFDAFLPQAGMTIHWADDFSTSFVWKKGYRPGGSDLKVGEPNSFESEFVTNYELSLSTNWFQDRLQINANVYYTKWKDQQVLTFTNEPTLGLVPRTFNAGLSELYGYEIELSTRPLDGLFLFANLGYSRTKFIDFDTTSTGGGIDFSGKEFGKAPRMTASVGGTYRHYSGAFLNATLNYKSSSYNFIVRQDGEFTNEKLDPRSILNMKLGYESEHAAIYLYARNLLDEEYITHRNTGPRLGHTLQVGDPRVLGIQLTTNW